MTASRMLSGPPQSQEVVLFALHPQTVVRPLRRAVRQVFAGLLEWLLETLQRHGMPRNVALARLNRTRWFGRLFDYVAVERMLNIFKLYLSQSDVLAVPRDFVDVYDAFSHEINRYCLSESVQPRADAPHGNRAFVVGGIDFTEETLKSMTRSLDPWPHQAQQTPLYPGKATSGGSAGAAGGSASPGAPSDTAHTSAPAGALVSVNRRYLVSQDNLALVGNMVARLQGALRQRKKALDVLLRERAELDAQLKSRKRELLDLCVSLTNKRILADSLDFEATLLEVRQQFDPLSGAHRNSRALEEISQHMRVINRCAKAFARK
ncbi:asparagine-rich protein, putative [Babesia caballi]|uniref:Asparagine-rich protein, putative n=1 Tax=Babesia caballi TaxID=5871 RepID=A0AAV4LWD2_BABCB|nr:asparagine-rich protein, putative [Babesia caballi]